MLRSYVAYRKYKKSHIDDFVQKECSCGIFFPYRTSNRMVSQQFKKKYPIDKKLSIKNTMELVEKIKDIKIKTKEILGFFDIINMYPNTAGDMAIQCIEKYLVRNSVP